MYGRGLRVERHVELAPVGVIGPGDEAAIAIYPLREGKVGRSLLVEAFPEGTTLGDDQYTN